MLLAAFVGSCTATVRPDEYGVEQHRFGTKTGVGDEVFGPGLYAVGPGTTMHTFPRGLHVLEASAGRPRRLKDGPSSWAANELFGAPQQGAREGDLSGHRREAAPQLLQHASSV